MVSLRVALAVVHMTIAIFLEKDNTLLSFSQFIMGSLLCALVCLCKFLWTFVHSLWTELWGHIMDFWREQKALYMEELYFGLLLPCEPDRDVLHNKAWYLHTIVLSATERAIIMWRKGLEKKEQIFGKIWAGQGCLLRYTNLSTKLLRIVLAQNFILSTCFINSVSDGPACLPHHLLLMKDRGRNGNQFVRHIRCSRCLHIYAVLAKSSG